MKKIQVLLIWGIISASVVTVWGHGTEGLVEKGEGLLVSAGYDDGEPMSYAEFKILGPDSDIPFQKGRTDRNGRLMFRPDKKGLWQIIVSDGMGHRLALKREIFNVKGDIQAATPDKKGTPKTDRFQGIIMGVSIILGLFGIVYGWKARSH
jgi:nickel transport protein